MLKRVLGYLRPYVWLLSVALAAMLISQVAMYCTPIFTMHIVDTIVERGELRTLLLAGAGMIAAVVVMQLFRMTTQYMTSLVAQHTLVDMRRDLFRGALLAPLGVSIRRQTGDTVSRLTNDLGIVSGLVGQTIIDLVTNILTVVGVIAVMFYLNSSLALASLSVLPLVALTFALFQRQYYLVGMRVQQTAGQLTAYSTVALQGLREIKAFRNENTELANLGSRLRDFFLATMRRAWITALSGGAIQTACGMGQVVVFLYGGYQVMMGRATLGQIVAFTSYLGLLYGPVQQLTVVNLGIRSAMASVHRAFEIIDSPAEPDPGRRHLERVVSEVHFEDVWFSYVKDRPVLRGCDLRAGRGEMIALVGASGSGKTTLVSMLPRLFDPSDGRVTADGVDVREFTLASLRDRLGIVSQDVFLFNASLKENILYGRPGASDSDFARACRAARLDEIAAGLPKGYDEILSERALQLSPGQRQRISLARVMIRDPDVIIMDEATSALDSESEMAIREGMAPFLEDRIVVVIAHRLATVQQATRIYVLENGRIVSTGTHAELMDTSPQYRCLYEEQFVVSRA